MGLWQRLTERDAYPDWDQKADIFGLTWASLTDGLAAVKSGVSVNVDTALKVSTVFACARVLAEDISTAPLHLLRVDGKGNRQPAKDHPLYSILHRRPNEWMTSFEFREQMMFHAVLTGNAYAYIGRGMGKVVELIPLVSNRVKVTQASDYGLVYDVTDSTGRVNRLARTDVLHLRGPSWNGFIGMNAIELAREAIGLAIATEETHARLHANGAQPGGLLTTPQKLSPDALKQLAKDFSERQGGVANRFKTLVLDCDLKYQQMGMDGVDAEHLATRKYQVEEICRTLRVFAQMIGHSDKTTTFASAEAFFLAHVIYSLMPWVRRWEEVLARDLFPDEPDLIAKFNMNGMLRGDAKTRSEYYASAITNGHLTRNEVRELEDLNKLPGLDDPLIPLNMGTQAERDAAAKEVTEAVKAMLRHSGGRDLDDGALEHKIGRVLSARNEKRIVAARDELSAVLDTLPTPESEA